TTTVMSATPAPSGIEQQLVDRLRATVQSYLSRMQYKSAAFWADKLVSLSRGQPKDVYNYCQCLYLTKQYHRAIHHLKQRQLHVRTVAGCHLTALCHYDSGEFNDALAVLDSAAAGNGGTAADTGGFNASQWLASASRVLDDDNLTASTEWQQLPQLDEFGLPCRPLAGSLALLRGRVFESLGVRPRAVHCFVDALRKDAYCYEAFEALFGSQNLRASEEAELLANLHFDEACQTPEEAKLLQLVYGNRVNKYGPPKELEVPDSIVALKDNGDLVTSLAERYFYACHFHECQQLTSSVLANDPFNDLCLPLHIAALKELGKDNQLFLLGHQLVELYPSRPISWYAVGCYYLCIHDKEMARRYLMKCTRMNRYFGPGWIALGHALAEDTEHDQAIAAYTTAIQAMQGSHVPYLYIGLEYGLTNNLPLASEFFDQAVELCPNDPFLLHERGVTYFNARDYAKAEEQFRLAVGRIDELSGEMPSSFWEPVFNNLGHTCRKLKRYDEAIQHHQRAWSLYPGNAATLTALGYAFALNGDFDRAVDHLTRSLSLNSDDKFSSQLLSKLVEVMAETHLPWLDCLLGDRGDSLPTMNWQDLPDRKPASLAMESPSGASLSGRWLQSATTQTPNSAMRLRQQQQQRQLTMSAGSVESVDMEDVSMDI
ncbi:hypothetical protein BOX15_Mlig003590g3, partial [Macrostomum lignano]